MRPLSVLLFDLDGTLVRTHGAGMRAFERGLQAVMGWEHAIKGIAPAGMTDPYIAQAAAQAQQGRPLTPEELQRFYTAYLRYLEEELAAAQAYQVLPGIREFLVEVSQDTRCLVGLGTGNLEAGAQLKLTKGDLNRYFRFGGYGSDSSLRPEVLAAGVRRAQALVQEPIPAERVLVIGDTPHDISAGKAIGARTLAVATGPYSVDQLQAHAPDWVLEDFLDAQGLARLRTGFILP